MNVSTVLQTFQHQQLALIDSAKQQLIPFKKLDCFENDFYEQALNFIEIPDFEKIAGNLLNSENYEISASSFIDFWINILNSFETYSSIEHACLILIKNQLQAIRGRGSYQDNSEKSISKKIKNLEEGHFFHLFLSKKTILKQIVTYEKIDSQTYNIYVYQAEINSAKNQGGLKNLQIERAYPLYFYSHVPITEIFGPIIDDSEGCILHVQHLMEIVQHQEDSSFLDAMKALSNYQEKSHFFKTVDLSHANTLKKFNTFIFHLFIIYAKDDAIMLYKAILGFAKVFSTVALFKSLPSIEKERLHERLVLLLKASQTTARHISRNEENIYFNIVFERAVATISEIKNKVSTILENDFFKTDVGLNVKLPDNQVYLAEASVLNIKKFLKKFSPEVHSIDKSFISIKDLVLSDFNSHIHDLDKLSKIFNEIENRYPEMLIATISLTFDNISLSKMTNYWQQFAKTTLKKALKFIENISEKLSMHAFKYKRRFSDQAQNCGVQLLLHAFTITTLLDKNHCLKTFFPECFGFRNLTQGPELNSFNAYAWKKRQKILKIIGTCGYQKMPLFKFSIFSDNEKAFAEILFKAFPFVKEKILGIKEFLKKENYVAWKETSLEMLLWQELLENQYLEDDQLNIYSMLSKTAMHVEVLSQLQVKYQQGFENKAKVIKAFFFDLKYAKTSANNFEIQSKNSKKLDENIHYNLLKKGKKLNTQNETIQRYEFLNDDQKLFFIFEESLSVSGISVYQLILNLTQHLYLLRDPKVRSVLKNYLFKIDVDVKGKESSAIDIEMKIAPQAFKKLIMNFLERLNVYALQDEAILFLSTELYVSFYAHFQNVKIEFFKSYPEFLTEQWALKNSLLSIVARLKLIEIKIYSKNNFEEYQRLGEQLQNQIRQKNHNLTEDQSLWWANYRFKMAKRCLSDNEYVFIEHYDYLDLSSNMGQWKPIPKEILVNEDFYRLFLERICEWKEIGSSIFSFYDNFYGQIEIEYHSNMISIKKRTNRSIYRYLKEQESISLLKIPSCLSKICSWWLHEKKHIAKGHDLSNPRKAWLKRESNGAIYFKDVTAKRFIELQDSLDESLNLYNSYYYTYSARLIHQGILTNYRDQIIFPFLRDQNSSDLRFERKRAHFYRKNAVSERLINVTFKEGIFLQGITTDSKSLEKKIILAFTKYLSKKDSYYVFPMDVSNVKKIEYQTIEIGFDKNGFMPTTMLEKCFSAYLSVVGKDYFAAYKYLEMITYDEKLEADEILVINWLIDSFFETSDCSAQSSSIKLKAFHLLILKMQQDNVDVTQINLPKTSIETLLLQYLNHFSTIPSLFKLNEYVMKQLVDRGMEYSKPTQYSFDQWNQFTEGFLQDAVPTNNYVVFQGNKKALLKNWQESLLDNDGKFLINGEIIDGFINLTQCKLVAGEAYPLKAFAYHYKVLSEEISIQRLWVLIYQIEMTKISKSLKSVLKDAFRKRELAYKLPLFLFDSGNNRAIVEKWFSQFKIIPEAVPEMSKDTLFLYKKNVKRPLISLPALRTDVNLFKISPFNLIQTFFESLEFKKTPSKRFNRAHLFKLGTSPGILKKETEFYIMEWQKGKILLNANAEEALPSKEHLIELEKKFYFYERDNKNDLIKEQIIKLLNKRPVEKEQYVPYILKEIKEDIRKISFDTLLKSLFFKDPVKRLQLLNRWNGTITLIDIKHIDAYLKYYLEATIVDRLLKEAKEIVVKTLEKYDLLTPLELKEAYKRIKDKLNVNQAPREMEDLLFEYTAGFCIRKQQSIFLQKSISEILKINSSPKVIGLVFQAFMNSGKTSVILSKLAKILSELGIVPFFVTHHSQYASLKSLLKAQHYKRLNQEFLEINTFKKGKRTSADLKIILAQLLEAKELKRAVLIQTSELLSLRCELINALKKITDRKFLDSDAFDSVQILAKIFQFIKIHAVFLEDEIDLNSNILEEFNLSLGQPQPISKNTLRLIDQVYVILSTDVEITQRLRIKEDDQAISNLDLKTTVFPRLIDQLLDNYPTLNRLIPLKNEIEFKIFIKKFVLNEKICSLEDQSFYQSLQGLKKDSKYEENLKDLSLLKGLCSFVLPIVLTKKFNQYYGFHQDKLVPYLGVDSPNTTEFGNVYAMACYYFQAALKTPVSSHMLDIWSKTMRNSSSFYAETHGIKEGQTDVANYFFKLTGLKLHTSWGVREEKKCLKRLNQDPAKCLSFYKEFAKNSLNYNSQVINAGPHALTEMPSFLIGCSGTLWNRETFSVELQQNVLLEIGGEGCVLVKLEADMHEGLSHVYSVNQATPQELIETVFKKRGVQNFRAIMDVAGFLRRYSNHQVAEMLLASEHLKDEIKAVLFLNKDKDNDYFCLKIRDRKDVIRLQGTTTNEIERHINVKEVFVYFDELRTTGSDIPIKDDAHCVVTFDTESTTMRSLCQGVMRARGFFSRQTMDILLLKSSEMEFESVDYIYNIAIGNQARLKVSLLLKSYFDQVKEKYRSMIFKEMIEGLSVEENSRFKEKYLSLFDTYSWLFLNHFNDDPLVHFFEIQEQQDAYAILNKYAIDLKERFLDANDQFFNDVEIKKTTDLIDAILTNAKFFLTENVNAYTQQVNSEVTVQQEEQNETELNSHIENETQNQLEKRFFERPEKIATPIEWVSKIDMPEYFSDYSGPKIHSIKKLFNKYAYDRDYSVIFLKNLMLTENLTKTYETQFSVFHVGQKNIFYFLIVKIEQNFCSIYLDIKEAQFWREELKRFPKLECWLFNIDGFSSHDDRIMPSQLIETVKSTSFFGNFFNGNIINLMKNKPYLKKWLNDDFYDLKCQFLLLKTKLNRMQALIFANDILFQHPLENLEITFENEEDFINPDDLNGLTVEQINALPYHVARSLSNAQVPFLRKNGFFLYLTQEQFLHVTKEQIPLLPVHCYHYLILKEQIQSVGKEYYKYLNKKALKYIKSKDLVFLEPSQIALFSKRKREFYQNKKIKKIGIECFAKSMNGCLIPFVLPLIVPFLRDHDLNKLRKKSQLINVAVEKYQFLRASQLHLIPEKNWIYLKKEDFIKYFDESVIDAAAKNLIQTIPTDWIDDLDERLVPFYSKNQVRSIKNVNLISFLTLDQIVFLRADFLIYLSDEQFEGLDVRHSFLIELLDDPILLKKLSLEGVKELTDEQIYLIEDRETLLKLDLDKAALFSTYQIDFLNTEETLDQNYINRLTEKQIARLEDDQKILLLPFLKMETIQRIEPDLFFKVEEFDVSKIKYLSGQQLKCLLEGSRLEHNQLFLYVKSITEDQWKQLSLKFIMYFFIRQPTKIVKLIPLKCIKKCPKTLLFRWLGVNNKRALLIDICKGMLSIVVYPVILILAIFNAQWRNILFYPLFLFSRETYYRNYFLNKGI